MTNFKCMNRYILIIILILSFFSSCREVYDPKIDIAQGAIVVEGLVTDEVRSYEIKLSTAMPFGSSIKDSVIENAKVSISDELGDTFNLTQTGSAYVSDPSRFVGQPGRSYTLHIVTPDGNIYESTPQILPSNDSKVSASAAFASKEILVQDFSGQFSKTTIKGVDFMADIKYKSDSLPRFRFQPTITTEYSYTIFTYWPSTNLYVRSPVYFCWSASVPDELVNITDEAHQGSSNEILKHSVCFIPTEYTHLVDYTDEFNNIIDSIIPAPVVNKIITLKQFRINDEAFEFYKNINSLLSAQGKIFDPIAFQIKGNIVCKNNPQKPALGFFEASSAKTYYFFIKPGRDTVHTLENFNFPSASCCVRWDSIPILEGVPESPVPPSFWIN
jgi:hypothetical protein